MSARHERGRVVWTHVARAVLLTAGRPALLRASGLAAAVGIAATIIFAGNGLRAADLVHIVHTSWQTRAALWTGWTLLASPAVASAFDAPGTRTLRALGLPRAPLVASLLLLLACVNAPWALLFARGGGAVDGLTATALAIALQCALFAARARLRTAWLLPPALALAACDPPAGVALLPALALAIASARAAWIHGPEKDRATRRVLRPMPAALALATAHLLRLARGERSRLSLGALGAAAGSAVLALSLRNDPTDRPLHRGVLVMALPIALAAAVLASPLLHAERQLRPWLRSIRVRAPAVVFAFSVALVAPSSALAGTAGAIAGAVDRGAPLSLGGAVALAAAIMGLTIAAWARMHDRTRRRDPVVFVVGVVAITAAALGGAAAW